MRQIRVGCADVDHKAITYVNDVLNREMLSNGLYTQRFEKQFAEVHGCSNGLFVNSGTDALRIALASMKEYYGWKDGDEVICPATTFVASANVILQNQLKVKFVDVDPHSFNITTETLESRISKTTKAIMPVHLMGLVCDMKSIMRVAKQHNLRVIEDSCESMGVARVGGDVACYSTYMAHIITTGVGGLAITKNRNLASLMRSYANHGRVPTFLGGYYGGSAIGQRRAIGNRFKFVRLGYSSRCTEMEAALGLAQLERLPRIISDRQNVRRALQSILSCYEAKRIIQITAPPGPHAAMMFPIVVLRGSRDKLVYFLERKGIETRPLMPLLSQPLYRRLYGNLLPKFPVSKWLDKRGFYIGCHQKMTAKDIEYIGECFREFYGK